MSGGQVAERLVRYCRGVFPNQRRHDRFSALCSAVAEQTRDLRQMQARLGEVAGGLGPAFPVDDVLTPHAFVDQSSLQRPRVQGELVGDGVGAALPGGQQPSGSSATRSDSGALAGRNVASRYFVAMRRVSGSALSMRRAAICDDSVEPAPGLLEAHRAAQRVAVRGVRALLVVQERDRTRTRPAVRRAGG